MPETRAARAQKRAVDPQEQQQRVQTGKRQCQEPPLDSSKHPAIPEEEPVEEMLTISILPPGTHSWFWEQSTAEHTPRATAADTVELHQNVGFWAQKGHWPRQSLDSNIERLFARKRPLSQQQEQAKPASSARPSDQRTQEEKLASCLNPRYATILQTKGVYMGTSELGIANHSRQLCRNLLIDYQMTPLGTIFDAHIFERACTNLQGKSKARLIRDLTELLVPSAENLALYSKPLNILIESVNEVWSNSIPLLGTAPQPDYSVGFQRDAFTSLRLKKLAPFIGDFVDRDTSYFMATHYMYFPFLACEVVSDAGLDIADRQNTHSMALAARGVVELFRAVGRENEINRQILSFSISHDHRSVRIYGYYPVMNGKETKYYRHPIHAYDILASNGREKWVSHRFIKNIYCCWIPGHFQGICSAIDQLPAETSFDVPPRDVSTSASRKPRAPRNSEINSASAAPAAVNQSCEAGRTDTPVASCSRPQCPSKEVNGSAKKS